MHCLTWIALVAAVTSFAPAATALELVMFRRAGCSWCAAWDRDIGPIYDKTDVGRRVPIRFIGPERVSEMKSALKSPVRFTPTFVLVDEDREIGRIEGYPGADFFWGRLEGLLPPPPDDGGERSSPAPTTTAAR